jgi:hypothetical protein
MATPDEVMETYVAMWNATDDGERRRLAERALTEDGSITYPGLHACGWDDVVAAIGALQHQIPGVRFVATSGVEQHHGWLRASWRMVDAGESKLRDGEDVGQLADDGRFRRVIGFHDPLPPPGFQPGIAE